ncbi:MAG: hypothetical protein AAF698_00080 [Pseudomonadota bacterium]
MKVRAAKSARTGALAVLAASFVASAVLRAGDVLAERPELAAAIQEASDAFGRRVGPELIEASRVLAAIEEREAAVAAREAALREREAALSALESRLETRFGEIEAAHDDLAGALRAARGAAEEDVAHLATVYAQMKPARAGALFGTMDPRFAAGFLARMQPQAAAAILAGMDAERAYAVSLIMAGRNAALSGTVGQGAPATPPIAAATEEPGQ